MIEEIWKDIKDYEGLFQINPYGDIKTLERIDNNNHLVKEKLLIPSKDKDGYLYVNLTTKDKTRKFNYIHKLVAQTFLPNPENKPYIDHINGFNTDNRVENLQWTTHKENCNNLITKRRKSKPIIQFNPDGEVIQKWYSVKDVLLFYNVKDVRKIKNCTFKPWMKQIHLNKHIPQIFN